MNITEGRKVDQIFIEDYVVSFLKHKKSEAVNKPIRLGLFGQKEEIGEDKRYYIYGAACKEEGRTIEETGRDFFAGHSFLGFVNVHSSDNHFLSKYKIFFTDNEAMQEYLLNYAKENHIFDNTAMNPVERESENTTDELYESNPSGHAGSPLHSIRRFLTFGRNGGIAARLYSSDDPLPVDSEICNVEIITGKAKKTSIYETIWSKIKMLFLGILCFALAIIISTIDDYTKMHGFTQAAKEVIVFIEETG